MVAAAGGSAELYDRGGVVAMIFPDAPERSVFNSVFYEDTGELLDRLGELAPAYERAGVRAWTVWAPEDDAAAAEVLEGTGHVLDAKPHDMALDLAGLAEPGGDGPAELRESYDPAAMARINEIAYGYPEGEFAPVERAPMEALRIYFADLDGDPVSTLGIWAHDEDALVAWVATVPEARGGGISTQLLEHALADARDAGLRTSTLQATKLGAPVYAKLGFRDLGPMHMWERRANR